MKKLFLILLLSSSVNAFAQEFQLGSGVILYRLKGIYQDQYLISSVDQSPLIFNLLFSAYIPLKQLKEELYIGVNPNAGLGFSYGSFSGDLPVYMTMRYGAGSSKETLKEFGAAIGIGGRFSGFSTPLTYIGAYTSTIICPSVMAQISFTPLSRGAFSIRADLTPMPVNKDKGNFIGTISEYNFILMRTF
ncbi:MAG TPA: hypothetical protein VNW99_09150 [Cytophagaceae bacterium]|jgi:hypothetical protein|nr:hypothetical protein [Cytophagaceae bacterium]